MPTDWQMGGGGSANQKEDQKVCDYRSITLLSLQLHIDRFRHDHTPTD